MKNYFFISRTSINYFNILHRIDIMEPVEKKKIALKRSETSDFDPVALSSVSTGDLSYNKLYISYHAKSLNIRAVIRQANYATYATHEEDGFYKLLRANTVLYLESLRLEKCNEPFNHEGFKFDTTSNCRVTSYGMPAEIGDLIDKKCNMTARLIPYDFIADGLRIVGFKIKVSAISN